LRVADSSLFPDALEINPYVTIMALADRVAEGIRSDAATFLQSVPSLGMPVRHAASAAAAP
jgi:choline dehydrogenase-like flavoprotein